ncbi:SCO family protein [Microvirga sp. TS319]|uniref:SCO family protein n=1 Tax=Microvirga sp. TS319 TaxID=3241165 RepID=UPI00351A09C7
MKRLSGLLLALALCRPALAGLTERDLSEVTLAPQPEARVPASLNFRDLSNRNMTLGEALAGRPALLIPVDYTCRSTCGPALSILEGALIQTGLQAGRDYRLIVVGIDPKDSSDDARAFVHARIGDDALLASISVLTGDPSAVRTLTASLGYRALYDAGKDQFAHPSGVVALLPDGRVSRVLSALALDPQDLRFALVESGEGRIGGMTDRLMLLCYGFDAVHGIYTPVISRVLQAACAGTLAVLMLALAAFHVRSRHVGSSSQGKS